MNGQLISDLFTKPTDTHQCVVSSGDHPCTLCPLSPPISWSVGMHLWAIVSDGTQLERHFGELAGFLRSHSYSEHLTKVQSSHLSSGHPPGQCANANWDLVIVFGESPVEGHWLLERMCGVKFYLLTYLPVCLLHGHWHVSGNNAVPFLKVARVDADCKTAGRELKIPAAWKRGELLKCLWSLYSADETHIYHQDKLIRPGVVCNPVILPMPFKHLWTAPLPPPPPRIAYKRLGEFGTKFCLLTPRRHKTCRLCK